MSLRLLTEMSSIVAMASHIDNCSALELCISDSDNCSNLSCTCSLCKVEEVGITVGNREGFIVGINVG